MRSVLVHIMKPQVTVQLLLVFWHRLVVQAHLPVVHPLKQQVQTL